MYRSNLPTLEALCITIQNVVLLVMESDFHCQEIVTPVKCAYHFYHLFNMVEYLFISFIERAYD
jgi:hypothetical protein